MRERSAPWAAWHRRHSADLRVGAHLAEELEAHAIVPAPIHGVDGEEAVLRLDEEAAQALHDARRHVHVRPAKVKLSLVLRRAKQRRSQEEVVPTTAATLSDKDQWTRRDTRSLSFAVVAASPKQVHGSIARCAPPLCTMPKHDALYGIYGCSMRR